MDTQHLDYVTPFDRLTSSESLRIMKLIIPYVEPESQRFLALYIRFLELQNTAAFFQHFNNGIQSQEFKTHASSPMDIFQEIAPYISPEFAETFENISNIMNMMDMMDPESFDMSSLYGSMFSSDIKNDNNEGGESENE